MVELMASNGDKISLWTEGLDEGWSMDPSQADHMDRGTQSIKDIVEHVEMLVFRYSDELNCRLIVRFKEKILHLKLESNLIEASDPNDQTYQNIPVTQERLYQFLEDFIYEDPEPDESRINIHEDKKGIFAMLGAVVVLCVAIYFSGFYGNKEEAFMPLPSAEKLRDPLAIQRFYDQHAGIYATAIDDGEMLIELTTNGQWAYYDITKRNNRHYLGEMVSAGDYVPGMEESASAVVTDKRFVFYPKGDEDLEFLQRLFSKVADSRDELAYMDLPIISQGG